MAWLAGHLGDNPHLGPGLWSFVLLASAATLVRELRAGTPAIRLLGWDTGPFARPGRDLALELAGPVLFLAFVALRRWVPGMTFEVGDSGSEKFMNSMLFWANWHASSLPAQDLWLAGHPVHYHDFGHFHWAWIARSGGFAPGVAINLCLARVTVQVWEATYLLGRASLLPVGWSMGAATVASWGGNLAAVRLAVGLISSTMLAGSRFHWSAYDLWKPSRVLDHVVDEFPAFSAILGDVHAHHLALPWFVGWVAVLAATRRWDWAKAGPDALLGWTLPLGGGVLGTAATLGNLWNLPVVVWTMLLAVVMGLGCPGRIRRRPPWPAARLLGCTSGMMLLALLLKSRTMSVPLPGFSPPSARSASSASGPRSWLHRPPVRLLPRELRSDPVQLFDFWGLPVLVLFAGAVRRAQTRRDPWTRAIGTLGLVAVGAGAGLSGISCPGGPAWIWIGVLLLGLSLATARPCVTRAVVGMLIGCTGVLAGLELVYIQDRFVGDLVRYNSYFKLSYPVWPVITVIAVHVGRWLQRTSAGPGRQNVARILLTRGGLVLVVLIASVYPLLAWPARILQAARGDAPTRTPTLDAFRYLAHRPPWSVEAPMMEWIRQHVPPGDVIVEAAVPGCYHYPGRVASLTGRPVPLGWSHHQQQWRGSTAFELLDQRVRDVEALYRVSDPAALAAPARRLGARWVLCGTEEARSYGTSTLRLLEQMTPIAHGYDATLSDGSETFRIRLLDLRWCSEETDRWP